MTVNSDLPSIRRVQNLTLELNAFKGMHHNSDVAVHTDISQNTSSGTVAINQLNEFFLSNQSSHMLPGRVRVMNTGTVAMLEVLCKTGLSY